MDGEEWREIPGLEGRYEASSLGRIRSCDRDVWTGRALAWRRVRGRVLRPGRRASGHLVVMVGRTEQRYVHELVALAFHGPRPWKGAEIRHLNGDPADNRAGNLDYGSRSRNTQDRKWHGRMPGRLTPERVCRIKAALRDGDAPRYVAICFGVSVSTVTAIRDGRTHRDVTDTTCLEQFGMITW
ncbi:NUMOD4 motif-containing HNH endonuclease [Falsiroseomonas sp. CW058]|uniref:NUMOD4 motif-containing HNH endonuclease n=1 Tax=Falsiroseomonas sp. CW058 TaxID=3388664 RepID=UPI003D31E4ED